IVRIQYIFTFQEHLRISYYELLLNIDNSFFSKIILHFNSATVFDGDWENIFKEQKSQKAAKDYLIIGSDEGCDIVVEGEDIASKHAKIYKYQTGYFIEALAGSSGVYVNAQRIDEGTKKFIRKQDYVVLGKNGRVVNLQNIEL
ncbi:MAG: FHA domain-containing protein, partial [Campylobacterales bacterium]|nr:FHA domain-containing protein [Campylobacterales bacterium]